MASQKLKIALGDVQETLLIPLYGRARDAASRRPILGDATAQSIVDSIDYDFEKFRGASLPGSVLRTSIFDGWVREFLEENPAGTVVEIGCGLNTRFNRMDNGSVRWFDLDLPDVATLCKTFFTETDRRSFLEQSVFDPGWMDRVAATDGPWLFVAEAVFLYFPEHQVREFLDQLAARFPGSIVLLDTGSARMRDSMDKNASMKRVSARMKWACDDPRELENWGLALLDSRTFVYPQPDVLATWPFTYRHILRTLGRLFPPMANVYRMNKLQLPPQQ